MDRSNREHFVSLKCNVMCHLNVHSIQKTSTFTECAHSARNGEEDMYKQNQTVCLGSLVGLLSQQQWQRQTEKGSVVMDSILNVGTHSDWAQNGSSRGHVFATCS